MSKYVITYRYEGRKRVWGNKVYDSQQQAKNVLVKYFWKDKSGKRKYGRLKKVL